MKNLLILLSFAALSFASTVEQFLHFTFDDKFNSEEAAATYKEQKCATCHGKNGEKHSARFRSLASMPASEIKAALIGYKTDSNFGGRHRASMQTYASKLTKSQIDNIVYYLKGSDVLTVESEQAEPKQKTKYNLFIK